MSDLIQDTRPSSSCPPGPIPSVSPADLDAQGVSRRGLLRRRGPVRCRLRRSAPRRRPPAPPPAPPLRRRRPASRLPRRRPPRPHRLQPRREVHVLPAGRRGGAKYGLDWMVFTEHSQLRARPRRRRRWSTQEILKARAENPRQLIFQGLEWYIPAAEHCTVFSAPGPARGRPAHPVRAAPTTASCSATPTGAPGHPDTARNEAHAVKAHPVARRAAPHRLRRRRAGPRQPPVCASASTPRTRCANWRDAAPEIMIGMEGAPGAQGGGDPRLARTDQHPRRVREQAVGELLARLPGGGVPHVRRLRLDDGDRRRPVGRDARRGQAVLDHHQLRRPPDRLRHLEERRLAAGQNFDNTGRLPDPVEHRHPAARQRLLARPVQPHPRGRDPLRLPRR